MSGKIFLMKSTLLIGSSLIQAYGGRSVRKAISFHLMKKLFILALFSLNATLLFSQQAITDAEVASASETLLKSQKDPKAWQALQGVIRTENYSSEIRSRVMFLFAVSHLLQMNTNLFASAMQTLQTRYPDESLSLTNRLNPDDWLVPCPECGGTGVKKAPYPTDPKSSASRCLTCIGTGKIFTLSPRVKSQVGTVLNEIKAAATENILFAEASKKARAEFNPQRRVTALQELVNKFAHRKDLEEAKRVLATTLDEVAKADAIAQQKKAEHELREQEDKDYRTISSSLETLPDSGIPVMVKEIDRFIEKYPRSSSRLDLEICKTKLQHRKTIHGFIWMGFYVCVGLALLSSVLAFIKGLFARKKKATGPLPIPGLNQANEEVDPLAGTFTDDEQP